mmetsp:Transcript_7597/g.19342  ORF Transcript_7597/g.19342 Transcript_7597/m.19342 type:complete len:237 (-) Transcript_7597:436-1146(-)
MAAKMSSALSTRPPPLTAASAVSYVSRLGLTPLDTISSKVRATRSGWRARCAAVMSALNAAGGGCTPAASISSNSLHVRMSRGLAPRRLPTSLSHRALMRDENSLASTGTPARCMSFFTRSASVICLARSVHSSTRSNVLLVMATPLSSMASYTSMARAGPTAESRHTSMMARYVDSTGTIPARVISRTVASTASMDVHSRITSLQRPITSGALRPEAAVAAPEPPATMTATAAGS